MGVSFVELADPYQSVTRSLKYALLFIGLVFLSYFLFEVSTGKRVHPAQYMLIGIAQIVFYLLLLSIAEHTGFDVAFAIAAIAQLPHVGVLRRANRRRLQRQEIAVELLIALPAEALVEALRVAVVGSSFERKSIGLGTFREPAGAIHQGMSHSLLAGFENNKQVVKNPLPGEVGGGENRIEVDEPDWGEFVLGEKQRRLALAEAGEQEAACCLFVGRPLVELAIRVKEWCEGPDVGGSGLEDFDLERFRVHADKGTRRGRGVNSY
jgi:Inner membrane protein CreD